MILQGAGSDRLFRFLFPFASEDRDWCDRALFAGHELVYAKEAIARHSQIGAPFSTRESWPLRQSLLLLACQFASLAGFARELASHLAGRTRPSPDAHGPNQRNPAIPYRPLHLAAHLDKTSGTPPKGTRQARRSGRTLAAGSPAFYPLETSALLGCRWQMPYGLSALVASWSSTSAMKSATGITSCFFPAPRTRSASESLSASRIPTTAMYGILSVSASRMR